MSLGPEAPGRRQAMPITATDRASPDIRDLFIEDSFS
jgi:hypothetical protein